MAPVELEPVDRVRITILIDNLTDALLVDQPGLARLNWPRMSGGAVAQADAH